MSASFTPPGPFNAQGKGYYNTLPAWKLPKETNATAVLINKAISDVHNPDKYAYLWLTEWATAWTLSGKYGQSVGSKLFFPNNIHQDTITVKGVVPNQHEFDKLVEFATVHMNSALDDETPLNHGACEFILYQFDNTVSRGGGKVDSISVYAVEHYDVYIRTLPAGHSRFRFAPEYTMELVVAYDYKDPLPDIEYQFTQALYEGNLLITNNTDPTEYEIDNGRGSSTSRAASEYEDDPYWGGT